MLWAVHAQKLDPLASWLPSPWSVIASTVLAALPVVLLFWLLVPRRWSAPRAAGAAALLALVLAILVFGEPASMAVLSFVNGAGFGLLPVGWTIFNAMLLYNITVETGHFNVVRRSVAGLSGDARIQAILIGFAFGAFLEGAAGGGTPVAICAAIMVGLGFDPFLAAVLCLIANTSPVAYGGLGTPLITLTTVTGLPTETLSVMAGHQLPLISLFVPFYMVKIMCTWRQTIEVWPALLVSGGSFAVFQYTFATGHTWGLPELYPMTDIGGGIFSLVVTAVFLRFWKPKTEFHFAKVPSAAVLPAKKIETTLPTNDPHAAEAAALLGNGPSLPPHDEKPLGFGNVALAWAPYALMSFLLLLTGLVRQMEGKGPVTFGPFRTNYVLKVPGLHGLSYRDGELHPVRTLDPTLKPVLAEESACLVLASQSPLDAVVSGSIAQSMTDVPEPATFNLAWLTAPGTGVFIAALLSMLMLRMNRAQVSAVVRRTFFQMKIPIPTICFMLGLSYITRYAGMDATLGYAFANTGAAYPFFAAIIGWLGVFLTGTDAGSNALFGSLQKITATQIFKTGVFRHLTLGQAQVLICTANSTGGVMGKMIDAQSICVATAATHQLGKEADIFKKVLWHSIALAAIVGAMTLIQAYVPFFTRWVPKP
jgi:L-lactate permease